MLFSKSSVLVLAMLFASGCFAQVAKRTLITVSKTDHTLSVIDPATFKVLGTAPVGPNPHEVVVSPDGKIAYVSNPGNGDLHQINVIDLVNRKALPDIDTFPLLAPHGLVLQNDKLWFTAQGSKVVARYDIATQKTDFTMGTGQDVTHMLYVTPNGKKFYTTNVQSGTVSVFENVLLQPTVPPTGKLPPGAKPHWDWQQTLIPVGLGAEGFDVSPDGSELWTVTPDGVISIIDLDKKAVAQTLNSSVGGAHRLKFTPDGSRVAVVSVRTGDLVFFDAKTRKEVHRIKTGQGATLLMDAKDNRLYISCTPNDYIAVIDLKTMKDIGHINAGGRPDGLDMAEVK